ncbi:MAG: flagellar assembly protein FliX [Caulobacterales bacterium]
MRIDGVRPVQQNATSKKADGAAGAFSVAGAGQTVRAAPAAAASATVGIEGLLALQAEDGPQERRKRAAKKGKDVLDALDSLKLAMLEGRGGAGAAQLLSAAASKTELSGDERLDSTLQEISVRAAVELAKLRLRQSSRG